jgi:hypothetical protein
MKADTERDPYLQGCDAYLAGLDPDDDSPYPYPSREYNQWYQGWMDASDYKDAVGKRDPKKGASDGKAQAQFADDLQAEG